MESRPATLVPARGNPRDHCPSDDDILAFLPGEISGPLAESIAAHIETCPLCRSRVSTLKQRISDRAPAAAPSVPERADRESSDAPTTQLPERRPRVPRRLNEYELLEPIGRGGMGLVYRARHVRLQRTVALKVLPHLALADDSAVIRMHRESAAAGRVQHPNIVFATDAGECHGIHYLVMEFVQGIDLSKLVAACGPLPIAAACEITRQAALGLAHIAECKVVHRDLKPSNMMLAADGTVKILDLGLALLREGQRGSDDSATESGYLLGTADYVAPEQLLDSHDADVRSDLYSLGCSFYKLLTGQAPFGGSEHGSVAKKLNAHQHVPPPPVSHLRPEVPPTVEALLDRLLAKNPDDRFQTPAELVAALAPLAAGADLHTLYVQAGERAELEGLPLPQPSRTPRPAEASTQTRGATPTPSPGPRSSAARPAWVWPVSIAVGALALSIGLLAVALYRPTSPYEIPTTRKILVPDNSNPLLGTHDLRTGPREYIWPGFLHSPPAVYQPGNKRLELRTNDFQLLQMGVYDGTPATFSLDIEQQPWHGDAGLFFNLHLKKLPGKPEVAAFSPVYFHFHPDPNGESLQVRLTNAWIDLQPAADFDNLFFRGEEIEFPQGRIRLSVTIDQEGVRQITVNGQAFPQLTEEPARSRYASRDMTGAWGLYSSRTGRHHDPTWFSNLVVTPAEKLVHVQPLDQLP